MPWPMPGCFSGFQLARVGDGADDILGPLIAQVAQPEGDRILAALGGEFVEEGFDRKHVALRPERPQRGGADRHGEQAMASIRQDGKS